MAIGNCDCCPRTNVPGSVVNVPGEPFACFICQADPWETNPDPDPYGEITGDMALPNPFASMPTASSGACGTKQTRFILDEALFMEQIEPLPIFLNSPRSQ